METQDETYKPIKLSLAQTIVIQNHTISSFQLIERLKLILMLTEQIHLA